MPGSIFVSLEGCEGVGKTTQAKELLNRFWDAGMQATLVHEPGTTSLGRYLRSYVTSERPLSREAELLLFEAARAQVIVEVIKPSLANGISVIADRFEASSVAYQGYGRKIDFEIINALNQFTMKDQQPDLTFLLDLSPPEGLRRVGAPQLSLALEPGDQSLPGREDVEGHRKFEDLPLVFHERVRKGFLEMAQKNPQRWVIIDAMLAEEQISQLIWTHILDRLKTKPR